ncbi:MAG: AcrR family transcriptional regulator [Bermanella sp.]|jgi:AcrR family transcriptional regulator
MAESLRARKKQATTVAILRQARELFLSQGYEETGMDEIAVAAGVSRTTLFNYFPSKIALLICMAERREQSFKALVEECCAGFDSTSERIEQIFKRWAAYLLHSPKLHALITAALTSGGRSDSANSAALGGYIVEFRGLLEEGRRIGDVREDYSIESLTQMLVSTLLTASYTLFHGEDAQMEAHFMENARFIAEAISAPVGLDEGRVKNLKIPLSRS